MGRFTASPEVRSLAWLAYAGAAACLVAAALPMSDGAPVPLHLAVAGLTAAFGTALLMFGMRLPRGTLPALVLLGTALTSVLVGAAKTTGGTMVAAQSYLWLTVYAGLFLSREVVVANAALVTAGLGAGLLASGLPGMLAAWLIVSGTAWVFGLALGRMAERVRRQADTDQLTGLPNRHAFAAAAARERALADRTGADLALALVDLDGFKRVNDHHGHAAGDRLLVDLAAAWRARLRPADVLARHGGDEFVLLLPGTPEAGAEALLARLRGAHPAPWSAGVAGWQAHETLDAALARADARLYAAKPVA
jgi:diguanylate cyclase (GGDEF)-like protein